MKTLKLMADYECFPLWEASPGCVGNIDPESLPISTRLRRELLDWANIYDNTLNRNNPVTSGFSSVRAEENFVMAGKELARHLQEELGKDFKVITKF